MTPCLGLGPASPSGLCVTPMLPARCGNAGLPQPRGLVPVAPREGAGGTVTMLAGCWISSHAGTPMPDKLSAETARGGAEHSHDFKESSHSFTFLHAKALRRPSRLVPSIAFHRPAFSIHQSSTHFSTCHVPSKLHGPVKQPGRGITGPLTITSPPPPRDARVVRATRQPLPGQVMKRRLSSAQPGQHTVSTKSMKSKHA